MSHQGKSPIDGNRVGGPLRIGIMTNYSLHQMGGAEAALDQLASLWHDAGHDVVVITPQPRDGQPTRPWRPKYRHVSVPRPFSTRFGLGRYVKYLNAEHARAPLDLVVASDSYWAGYVTWLFARQSGSPYVVYPHGSDIMDGSRFLRRSLPRRRMVRVFQDAAAVVCISRYMRDRLFALTTPAGPVRVIHNGWPDESHAASPSAPLVGKNIFSMGRVIERKGFQTLVAAYAQVRAAFPDVGLVIAGDGPNLQNLIEQARTLALPVQLGLPKSGAVEGVCFTGFVHGETKRSLLAGATLGVIPSIWQEPQSIALVEMLAAGLPVIAAKVGGIPDMIQPGVNGELYAAGNSSELASHLRRLLTREDIRQSLALQAAPSVEHLRWSRVADTYLHLFREVLAGRRICADSAEEPQKKPKEKYAGTNWWTDSWNWAQRLMQRAS